MLYFTDNGAIYCEDDLGITAKMTGCDISGQRIEAITPEVVREARAMGLSLRCETCGKKASLLVTV